MRSAGISAVAAIALAAVCGGMAGSAQAAPGPRIGENFLLPPQSAGRGRDIPSLAVDPADQNHIVESEIDPVNFQCDYNVSFDGGRTWTGGHLTARSSGENPPFPGPACSQNFDSGGYAHANNASITYGSGQNVYATFSVHRGEFNRPEANADAGAGDDALVARSTDGGRTFGPAVIAVPGGGAVVGGQEGLAGRGMRPQLTVQRGAGAGGQDRIYLSSWNCFIRVRASQTSRGGCLGGGGDRRILATRSDDGGSTWTTPVLVSATAVRTGGAIAEAGSPDEQAVEPSSPVVGPDGAIYVAYRSRDITDGTTCPVNPTVTNPLAGGFPATKTNCIIVAKSSDLGLTWTQRNTGVSLSGGGQPRLAIDPATPASVGSVYVTFHQRISAADTADVMLQRSADGGLTWSTPVRVNDDPAGTVQSFPQVSLSNGRVDVTWFDRRHGYPGPGGGSIADIYTARSVNNGASFGANRRVTDRSQNRDVGIDGALGSYSFYGPVSQSLADGSLLSAWKDSRTGNADNGVQDIFLSRMAPGGEAGTSQVSAASRAGLSVRLSRLALPGGGESIGLDPSTRVVVANENDVGSALAGAVLARANLGSLLLSPADGLPAIVKAEAARLRPVGAYVIGSTDSLSSAVSSDLRDATRGGENVVRVSSPTSMTTVNRPAEVARQIAELMRPLPGTSPEAVIVNPDSPEAASAAALAAALRLPVLFADARTTAPAPTIAAISSLGIKKALIVGPAGSVSPGVEAQLLTSTVLGAGNVRRIDGADQYAISEALLTEARTRGLPPNIVYVADGNRPTDTAVLGAAVGRLTGLMLLTPNASASTAQARLSALGLEPLVDRIVAATGTGGTDPAPPATPAPTPTGPPTTTTTPPPPGVTPTPTPAPPTAPAARRGMLSARVTPSADLRASFRFTTSGRLTLPIGVSKSAGCKGRVSVQVKRGSVTLSTRRVTLRKDCTYSVRVTFTNSRRFQGVKTLKFTARFLGNPRVLRTTAPARFARVRR